MAQSKDLKRQSKTARSGGPGSADSPAGSTDAGHGSPPVEVQPPPKASASGTSGDFSLAPVRKNWISRILPGRSRRDLQLQTLQAGYVEMLDLMRSIGSHLNRQAESQERLLESLAHFPDAVEGLKHVGKATEQQTEVLQLVREQIETTAKHEQDIVGSMQGFNRTLHLMDETNRNTSSTVSDLVSRSQTAESELRSMLDRSQQRLTLLSGVLGIIGLALIGGMIYLGLSDRGAVRTVSTTSPEPAGSADLPDSVAAAEAADATDLSMDMAESDLVLPGEEAAEIVTMEVLSAEAVDTGSTKEVLPPDSSDPEATPQASEPDAVSEENDAAVVPEAGLHDPVDDEKIEGIRNVVRRVFSFIGDEETVAAEADGPAPEATEPAGAAPAPESTPPE